MASAVMEMDEWYCPEGNRARAIDIITRHYQEAMERRSCEQCRFPWFDGLCECDSANNEAWINQCDHVAAIATRYDLDGVDFGESLGRQEKDGQSQSPDAYSLRHEEISNNQGHVYNVDILCKAIKAGLSESLYCRGKAGQSQAPDVKSSGYAENVKKLQNESSEGDILKMVMRCDPGPLRAERLTPVFVDTGEEEVTRGMLLCGRMFKPLFRADNGIHMVQAEKTAWIPEESLLCVGLGTTGSVSSIECSSIKEGRLVDYAIKSYEKHREFSYSPYVTSREVSERVATQLCDEAKEGQEKEKVSDAVIRIKKAVETFMSESELAIRDKLLEVATSFESQALEIRLMLARDEGQRQMVGFVLDAMSEGKLVSAVRVVGKPTASSNEKVENLPLIPCGRLMGHGEYCTAERMCGNCQFISDTPTEELQGIWDGGFDGGK